MYVFHYDYIKINLVTNQDYYSLILIVLLYEIKTEDVPEDVN